MKLIVLIIFLFSPVHIQPQATVEETQKKIEALKYSLSHLQSRLAELIAEYNATALIKQNYTAILIKKRKDNQKLNRDYSLQQNHINACNHLLKQCKDRTKGRNATQYEQEIDAVEKRIEEVLRKKNEKILLSQKQKEATLDRLNDAKSKLNKLKNEKERLLREIENCQPISNTSTVLVPESSTLSPSTSILNNFMDYKSSLINNLLYGIFGSGGRKS